MLKRDILQADETTLQVLREEGRPAKSKSYMWLYRIGREPPPIVLFDYKTTRSGKHPKRFLSGFAGYLKVDGYSAYDTLPGVTLVGCWSHARRKFDEALKVLPNDSRLGTVTTTEGLRFCNQLFAIERDLGEAGPEERYRVRLERSRPVLDAFAAWLMSQAPRALPQTALGQAIKYCQSQWDKLEAFLLDGRLDLDNNRSERSIKPLSIFATSLSSFPTWVTVIWKICCPGPLHCLLPVAPAANTPKPPSSTSHWYAICKVCAI